MPPPPSATGHAGAQFAPSPDRPEGGELLGETLTLNMGPSHPSTHGVLRIILELDGEIITKATPDIGYLHRGDEKIAENMQYNQFVPYTDRLDYLAPLANNVAYALAVEKLMGWELPPRGKAIRVICCELARISAHLLGIGAFAMDVGAVTVFLWTFTEREKIYNLIELLTGARFTTSYTRIGGRRATCRRPSSRSSATSSRPSARATPRSMRSSRATASSSIARRTSASSRRRTPSPTRSPVRTSAAAASSTTCAASTRISTTKNTTSRFPSARVGDCFDRYLVRMEEMKQSCNILEQVADKIPSGPINIHDPKSTLPEKVAVLTKMEELIHHFIVATEGVEAPPARSISGRKIRRANSASTFTASAAACRIDSRFAPLRS